jgi:hypothetical protein
MKDTIKTKHMTGLVDKAIAKFNQNELRRYEKLFNTLGADIFFNHSESIGCVHNACACLTRIILRPLSASYLHGFVEKSLIGQF